MRRRIRYSFKADEHAETSERQQNPVAIPVAKRAEYQRANQNTKRQNRK